MTSGLYGLFSFDGAPLDPIDLATLSLQQAPFASATATARAVDTLPGAVHHFQSETEVLILAGFLDEPEELAASLSLPSTTPFAELAARALATFGAAASQRMDGDWSLLHYDVRSRSVTLRTSLTLRDQICYATDGRRLAIAPDPLTLTRLAWVGRSLDPQGFALHLARATLRGLLTDQTAWLGIHHVTTAAAEIFSSTGHRTIPPAATPEPDLFRGTFDDAVEALTLHLRHTVGQQMRRYGNTAFLLSGGLDSTTLSAIASLERGPGAQAYCLTSIAPQGSNIPDEQPWGRPAAAQLGMDLHTVCPTPEASPFRPSITTLAHMQQPMPGLRHYLYDLFWQEASASGAHAVADGAKGEFCITQGPNPGAELWWLRRWRYHAIMKWRKRNATVTWPHGMFHVRLAPHFIATLPQEWQHATRVKQKFEQSLAGSGPVGFHPAMAKSAGIDNSLPFGLRHLEIFRNPRLLRFAASLPKKYFISKEHTRPLPRAILRGRVPDAVRLRTVGLPISPDYMQRYARLASDARERLPLFRAAGADAWIDLQWLESILPKIEAGTASGHDLTTAQFTACAAEFLLWAESPSGNARS